LWEKPQITEKKVLSNCETERAEATLQKEPEKKKNY